MSQITFFTTSTAANRYNGAEYTRRAQNLPVAPNYKGTDPRSSDAASRTVRRGTAERLSVFRTVGRAVIVSSRLVAGLEKSGRLVAICDQKIFLATRSQAAVVNLATDFSTKGPVWRPQFCARFHVRTNSTVRRPENERQVSENEIQNFENLSRYSRNF